VPEDPPSGSLLSAEFTDPRLVAVYDVLNPYLPGTQPEFYLGLAGELGARTVVDVGCGTGLVTQEFVRRGFTVVGLEPSAQMLAVARRRLGTERVRWINGDVASLGSSPGVRGADFAFMSGHVAQFFVTDESWACALEALHVALRRGGWLSFETRNPAMREWETWTAANRRTTADPAGGTIETWTEVESVADGVASCVNHYRFLDSEADVTARGALRFRTLDELERSLSIAGFRIERGYGDWDRRPLTEDSRELIVVAERY
jgi:SAM-dependent methyltransferase